MKIRLLPLSPIFMVYNLLYGPYTSKGRKIVFVGSDWKQMKCVSYARYLMSEHLGRELSYNETVDHIDEDKANDCIENYQLLTLPENTSKSNKHRISDKPIHEVNCQICGKTFVVQNSVYNFKIRRNLPMPLCSNTCKARKGGIASGKARQ